MSDQKISALTSLTGAGTDAAADLIPIVDTSATETKKITPTQLLIGMGVTSSAAELNLLDGITAIDTDGTLTANSDTRLPSQKAVKTYVDTAVTGLLDFKGSTDCSGNPNYPSASKGDSYVVSVAGKIGGASGKSVDVGDVYLATADNAGGTEASVGTSWVVLEHNLQGALLAANNLSDLANAATARTNLGVGTGDSPQFTAINLGHASDTTLTRVSAGVVAVEGVNILTTASGVAKTSVPCEFMIACSDLTTALTTGTSKAYFRAPYAFTLTAVRASLLTAGSTSGTTTIDINDSGTTVLSTKLTIDAGEKTSTTAATAAVISDSAIADDAEITIDIDAISGGATEAGLIVTLIGTHSI